MFVFILPCLSYACYCLSAKTKQPFTLKQNASILSSVAAVLLNKQTNVHSTKSNLTLMHLTLNQAFAVKKLYG